MSKERKSYFVPNENVPFVNENNVEEVTHFIMRRVVNAFLWARKDEYNLIPFVNIRGEQASGDLAINWFPRVEAAKLAEQIWRSEDPLARAVAQTATIEQSFLTEALAQFGTAKALHSANAVALQEAWEKRCLENDCG
jgi:hypothetical protein